MSDRGAIKLQCPSCGAHHERGYHMGIEGHFRCLRCGYVGRPRQGHDGVLPLDFAALRSANVRRCEQSLHPLNDWTPPEWLMCVQGELGELAGAMKLRRRGEIIPDEAIAHEMADVLIYLDLLAATMGIDLGEAVRQKFNIVSDRVQSNIKL